MAAYVFAPPSPPSVAVEGTDERFPVRRVFCVGRNYAAHAREMGRDPDAEPPFFFSKPADAVLDAGSGAGAQVPYPPLTQDLHHEIELVVALAGGGRDIDPKDALVHVFGYAAGVDLTRRDLQNEAKTLARPWDWAKGFDASAPLSPIRRAQAVGHPGEGRIWLDVDGETRQAGDVADMIWSVAEVIAEASRGVELKAGDLIFTGTPEGVGPIRRGQRVTGGVEGVGEVDFRVV